MSMKQKTNADCAAFASEETRGLTKREYMATHLLAGMLADPGSRASPALAELAVRVADCLLAALASEPEKPR